MPAFSKFMLLLMSEKQHLEDYGGYTLWDYTEVLGMTSFIQRRKSKCALFQNQKGASDKLGRRSKVKTIELPKKSDLMH